MSYMTYVLTGAGCLAFGALVAYLNSLISKLTISGRNMVAIMGTNFARLTIDALALLVTNLICKHFGLPVITGLICTAVGLSVGGIIFLKRLLKKYTADSETQIQDGGE